MTDRGRGVFATVALVIAAALWAAVMWMAYTARYHRLTVVLGVFGAIVALVVAVDALDL